MTITRSVDQEKQLTIFKVVGKPSFEKLREVIKPFYEKHPTKNLLWDFRNASFETLSSKNLESFADYVKQHGEVRAGGKTAFVVSKDLEYGIFRMTETFSEIRKIPFYTELILTTTGKRVDILLPATQEIEEILVSETKERFEAKNYPLLTRAIRIK